MFSFKGTAGDGDAATGGGTRHDSSEDEDLASSVETQ